MKRYIFLISGIITLTLAIIGIVVPGLPTTPLLLVSVWLFSRSSDRLLNFIYSNKILSRYISEYKRLGGMTIRQKAFAMTLMWCMVSLSITLHFDNKTLVWILAAAAFTGSIVMGFIVKTVKK